MNETTTATINPATPAQVNFIAKLLTEKNTIGLPSDRLNNRPADQWKLSKRGASVIINELKTAPAKHWRDR